MTIKTRLNHQVRKCLETQPVMFIPELLRFDMPVGFRINPCVVNAKNITSNDLHSRIRNNHIFLPGSYKALKNHALVYDRAWYGM